MPEQHILREVVVETWTLRRRGGGHQLLRTLLHTPFSQHAKSLDVCLGSTLEFIALSEIIKSCGSNFITLVLDVCDSSCTGEEGDFIGELSPLQLDDFSKSVHVTPEMYTNEVHANFCVLNLTPCTSLQRLTLKTILETNYMLVALTLLSSLPPTAINELCIDFFAAYPEYDLTSAPWEKFDKVFSEFPGLRKVTIVVCGLEAVSVDSTLESNKAAIYATLFEKLPKTKTILCVECEENW